MTTLYDPRVDPWRIDEADFYEIEDPHAQKEFLLRYAILAPSGHNTQPWSFRITDDGLEVRADLSRRLPICDPDDRELLISVGAAIGNLRVAAAHFGFESTVCYGGNADAFVALRETCDPDPRLRHLFGAILRRHTSRREFEQREIEPEILDRICEAVESSEMTQFVVAQERGRIGELVEEGDRRLLDDPRFRDELAAWVRSNETSAGDGMCADALGIPGPLSALAPLIIRNIDVSESRAKRDHELVTDAAGLIVLTSDDDRTALLRAGETLEILLLTLISLGIQYAFLNQVVEVPELRRELWRLVRTHKPPQLLLRIGYAKPIKKAMPRREVAMVTE